MTLAAKPYLRSVTLAPDGRIDDQDYPFSIPAVRELGVLEPHPDVTFFVGENGAGKSTVLEAIAVALGLPAEGGTPISCVPKACSTCSLTWTVSPSRPARRRPAFTCTRMAKPSCGSCKVLPATAST
jgi:predicted ATPase